MGGRLTSGVRVLLASTTVVVGCLSAVPAQARPDGHVRLATLERERSLIAAAAGSDRPTSLEQVRARYLRIARARLALAGAVGSGDASAAPGPLAITAPVSVAGRTVVVMLTWPMSTASSTLTVRDARTGHLIWKRQLDAAYAFDMAHLGAARRPALVVYATSFAGVSDPVGAVYTGTQTNVIDAIDLLTGRSVWTPSPLLGTFTVSPFGFTEANALYPGGVLHDRGGDRLLALDVTQDFGAFGVSSTSQAMTVDGATGALSATGMPVAGDDIAFTVPGGDLDGDGIDDWYAGIGGDAAYMTATSGADGSMMWTTSFAGVAFPFVVPTGDLDGDGRPDVVVSDADGSASGTVTAHRGDTGDTLFTRTGDGAEPLPGARRATIVIWSNADFANVGVTAVDGAGKPLWSHHVRVLPGGEGSASASYGRAGDVDADGVDDLAVSVSYASAGRAGAFTTVISGRSGTARTGRAVGAPLGFSVDGHGADFLLVTPGSSRSDATVYDGLSRRALWKRSWTVHGKGFLMSVQALPGASLTDFYDGRATMVAALDDRTGRALWSVTT